MLTVGVGSYGVAGAAFLGLFALLCAGWISRHWAIAGLIVASLSWTATGWLAEWEGTGSTAVHGLFDFVRSIALLFLVNDALYRLSGGTGDGRLAARTGVLIPVAAASALILAVLRLADIESAFFFGLIGHVSLAVIGLFLIENLYQMSRPNAFWSTKHLLIGAGTIFAFDLFLYTEALLFLRVDGMISAAQPIIALLAMPLILISARRFRDISINLPVSRSLLVSTSALLASGVYILFVAAIAYLIRGLGWTWGPTLQLIFLIGAAMVLIVLLSSTSLRHGGRRFIERNLFTFAYDYRREWLRLVTSMADTADELPLDRRALKATANLMDADGGVLFLGQPNGDLRYKSCWNIAIEGKAPGMPPAKLLLSLSPKHAVIVFGQPETLPAGLTLDDDIKGWLSHFRDPWIALALHAQNDLVGLIMITRPRMQRRLTWEDLDLLSIFSHQLGSYLTVEELARQVFEAEHFDRMSRHVTFVAHDLKNLISQLSLVLQQARHHAHDPAFVSDSFLTIGDAVEKMKHLMRRVQEGALEANLAPVDLSALVRHMQERNPAHSQRLSVEGLLEGVVVMAEPSVLGALLDHILDNAHDASGDDDKVTLSLEKNDGMARLSVRDDGTGMTRDFIETELFKPFASTKKAGFGVGMYQCRDWIQRWRGRLEVDSEPGHGTTITVALPLAETPGRERHADDRVRTPSGTAPLDPLASGSAQQTGERAA